MSNTTAAVIAKSVQANKKLLATQERCRQQRIKVEHVRAQLKDMITIIDKNQSIIANINHALDDANNINTDNQNACTLNR